MMAVMGKSWRKRWGGLGIGLLLALGGCAAQEPPGAKVQIPLPPAFSASGTQELAARWWQDFQDPALNQLIALALADNFSLLGSRDRLVQAQASYEESRAGLFPVLDSEGTASHARQRVDGRTEKTDAVVLGLSASYELDLWGRIDAEIAANRFELAASTADLDAAAISLSAEVANVWYLLVQQHLALELLDQQIATNSKALQVITAQFRTGQVPLADVLQQRQLVANGEGDRVLLITEKRQSQHQLNILLGQVPGTPLPVRPQRLLHLPPLPVTGLPGELIASRPDVQSAFLAVQAADQRVAAAIADQYPALRLSAALETGSGSASTLFRDFIGSLVGGLTAPLLDGGARRAVVRVQQAAAQEKLHTYGQTVLTAIGEVEDALSREAAQQDYLRSLQEQVDLATQTLSQVKTRYLNGVEDFERVLTAQISLQTLQQTMLTARRDLLLIRIALCRALGRGWGYAEEEATS